MKKYKIIQKGRLNVFVEINNGVININSEQDIPLELTPLPRINLESIIGRDKDRKAIHEMISSSEINSIAIVGIAGIGKTSLLLSFLQENIENYNHVVWIRYHSNSLLDSVCENKQLINTLKVRKEEILGVSKSDQFNVIFSLLNQIKGKNLFVIDNIENLSSKEENLIVNLPLSTNWKIITTSRINIPNFKNYFLSNLSLAKSIELFKKNYTKEFEYNKLENLLKQIDYHTLTIDILSKTAQKLNLRLSTLLERVENKSIYDIEKVEIFSPHRNNRVNQVKSYLTDLFNLNNLSQEEKQLIIQLSLFLDDFVDLIKIKEISFKWEEDFTETFSKPYSFTDNLSLLLNDLFEKGWLLKKDILVKTLHTKNYGKEEPGYKLHPLIKEVIQMNELPNLENCKNILSSLHQKLTGGYLLLEFIWIIPLINKILRSLKQYENEFIAELKFYTAIAMISLDFDDDINFSNCKNYIEQSFAFFYKRDKKVLIELKENLIDKLERFKGDFQDLNYFDTEVLKIEIIDLRIECYGAELPDNCRKLYMIAWTQYEKREYGDAILSLKKALRIKPIHIPIKEYNKDLMYFNFLLGQVYYQIKKYADAVKYFEDSLFHLEKVPNISIDVLKKTNWWLGASYEDVGNYEWFVRRNYDLGIEYLKKAKLAYSIAFERIDENNLRINYSLATSMYSHGIKNAECLNYMEEAVHISSKINSLNEEFHARALIHLQEIREKKVDELSFM